MAFSASILFLIYFTITIFTTQCFCARILVFPKGSKFFLRMNSREDLFDYTTNFVHIAAVRINWDLPDHSLAKNRITKRDLRSGLQELFDRHNINGEKCIEKFVCETQLMNTDNLIFKVLALMLELDGEEFACVNLQDCPISIWDWISSDGHYK